MNGGAVIGIDFGGKRVGVALSDPDRKVAFPSAVLDGSDTERLAREIARLVEEREATLVVIGLPKQMDGSIGESAGAVLRFAARLEEVTTVEVKTWDERLSSVEAERTIRYGTGRETRKGEKPPRLRRRKGKKEDVDRIAAVLILQGWLDRQRGER